MKRYLYSFFIFLLLVAFDQYTKYWAVINLKGTDGINIIPDVFKLLYLENHGAAFGMFQNQRVFLLVTVVAVLGLLMFFYVKIPDTKRFIPLSALVVLISGGAVGNMIDRIVNGMVTDFLYFELIDFPIFNVADCYVVIAVFAIAFLFIFYYSEDEIEQIFSFRKKEQNISE